MRICGLVGWRGLQTISYALTVLTWGYWRIIFFPFFVLWSIAVESKSLLFESACSAGTCTWQDVPERVPFLGLLGTLAVLNYFWFWQLLKKGYREFRSSGR